MQLWSKKVIDTVKHLWSSIEVIEGPEENRLHKYPLGGRGELRRKLTVIYRRRFQGSVITVIMAIVTGWLHPQYDTRQAES